MTPDIMGLLTQMQPDAVPPPPDVQQRPQITPDALPQAAAIAQSAGAPVNSDGRGMLKQMLTRFSYGMGQALAKNAGLPTDAELATQRADINLKNANAAYAGAHADAVKQNVMASPVFDPATGSMVIDPTTGTPVILPQAQHKAFLDARAKMAVAKTSADSRTDVQKFKNVANVINQQLKAQGMGVELTFDDSGAPQFRKMTQDQLPIPVANKGSKTPNRIGLIIGAQQGDPEAAKALDTLRQDELNMVRERGNAFGQGRLWSLQKVLDPETGETTLRTGFDVLGASRQGKHLIPVGGLSQKEVISAQQLQSEAIPAISGVRQNLKAFDNEGDRAIFARVMEGAGKPAYGQEAGWMGSVLNQALKEKLSPEGQAEAQSLARLAETMGRMRSTLGLPATDQSMAVTLALLPGKSTPNSKYAGQQVNQIEEMIKQAVSIPAYGGKPKAPAAGNQAPLVQKSASTGQYRYSTDGGKSWQMGQPPK